MTDFRFPRTVEVDARFGGGHLLIDGEKFPYYISADEPPVLKFRDIRGEGELTTLTITLLLPSDETKIDFQDDELHLIHTPAKR